MANLSRNCKIHLQMSQIAKRCLWNTCSSSYLLRNKLLKNFKNSKLTKYVCEFVAYQSKNCKIHLQMSQIAKRRLWNICLSLYFPQNKLLKNIKNSNLTKYVLEFVADLNRNSKIHFANVKNNQKTSLKYLFSIICSTKLAFGEFQKVKNNQICTRICGKSI